MEPQPLGWSAMTRRERHLNIINWFCERRRAAVLARMIDTEYTPLSDAALEEFARRLLADYAFSQKLNAKNKALREVSQ